jgi:hypothetical protein
MFKLCTNENHSYKHNEQINNQNINNSECFGVKFVKIYPEHQNIQNCLYFDCLFAHYVYMSGFHLYII